MCCKTELQFRWSYDLKESVSNTYIGPMAILKVMVAALVVRGAD